MQSPATESFVAEVTASSKVFEISYSTLPFNSEEKSLAASPIRYLYKRD